MFVVHVTVVGFSIPLSFSFFVLALQAQEQGKDIANFYLTLGLIVFAMGLYSWFMAIMLERRERRQVRDEKLLLDANTEKRFQAILKELQSIADIRKDRQDDKPTG